MNEFSEMDLDLALENELRLELESLDRIFMETTGNSLSEASRNAIYGIPADTNAQDDQILEKPPRLSYSAYELAEAEIEKEELQDKLRLLMSKTEEFDKEFMELNEINHELKAKNEQLTHDNDELKEKVQSLEQKLHDEQQLKELQKTQQYEQLEYKLAETKGMLAKYQQLYEDMMMVKEIAVAELEKERLHRVHAEKERDAYSAAYEASLQHFEKWSQAQRKSLKAVSRSNSYDEPIGGPAETLRNQENQNTVQQNPSTNLPTAPPAQQRSRLKIWS
jgi:hypothetical protein